MFMADTSRIYSIVPFNKTIEHGLKLIELCLPHDKGVRFNRTCHMALTEEAILESEKQQPFSEREAHLAKIVRACRGQSEVFFFCVDDEIVGAGEIIERIGNLGIVIRHDIQGTGIASFFAERFMNRFEDKIAAIGKPWGALVGLAERRKQKMQNNIQQETAL